nr:cysteine-rich venom protein pseudechetoxin-like [Pogona vitticeps]
MRFSIIILPLVTVLQQSIGEDHFKGFGKMNPEKQKEILDEHNTIRRGVQPTASNMLKMTWSEKAAESARRRATKCLPIVSPRKERTVDGVLCSENVLHTESATSWPNVIKVWQRKESNFQYGIGVLDPEKDVFSYTQLIWYSSHLVGCASAYCTGTPYPFIHICQYCPAGNFVHQLQTPYAEGPPCGDCPHNCEDKLCTNPCKHMDKKTDCKTIIKLFSCETPFLEQCRATCECETKIK